MPIAVGMRTQILRVLTAVLAAGVLFTLLPGATAYAAPSTGAAEDRFVDKINAERRKAGLNPLAESTHLTGIARNWSKRMAGSDKLAHNPSRSAQVTVRWSRLGENVGVYGAKGASTSQLVDRLHRSLMKSAGHRKNILGKYKHVGIGVVVAKDGTMWVTQNFLMP